jgi:NAD dependent epimerase/dehydratase family enzyme
MMQPIQLGIGAPFGSGKQIQPWIHLHDLAALYLFAAEKEWEGVYNAVSPNSVTNEFFTKTLATVLRKPLFMPNIPPFLMKMILGERHELLFENRNISVQKALDAGFVFKYKYLDQALEQLLS